LLVFQTTKKLSTAALSKQAPRPLFKTLILLFNVTKSEVYLPRLILLFIN